MSGGDTDKLGDAESDTPPSFDSARLIQIWSDRTLVILTRDRQGNQNILDLEDEVGFETTEKGFTLSRGITYSTSSAKQNLQPGRFHVAFHYADPQNALTRPSLSSDAEGVALAR